MVVLKAKGFRKKREECEGHKALPLGLSETKPPTSLYPS